MKCVLGFDSTGNPELVELSDGTFARLEPPPGLKADCSRKSFLEQIDGFRQKGSWPQWKLDFYDRMASDSRLVDFWKWLENVEYPDRCRWAKNPTTACNILHRGLQLPGKPGNLTPAQRKAYFDKVRQHADGLIALLENTIFDNQYEHEVPERDLGKPLHRFLDHWGDEEDDEGHIVAFRVCPDGEFRMPFDYPRSHLAATLIELIDWTHWDDQWDGRIFGSSAPIAQANSASTPLIYFTCSVHSGFRSFGVAIPFPVLATLANVLLDRSADEQVDEDTVRKQVSRFERRRQGRESSIPF